MEQRSTQQPSSRKRKREQQPNEVFTFSKLQTLILSERNRAEDQKVWFRQVEKFRDWTSLVRVLSNVGLKPEGKVSWSKTPNGFIPGSPIIEKSDGSLVLFIDPYGVLRYATGEGRFKIYPVRDKTLWPWVGFSDDRCSPRFSKDVLGLIVTYLSVSDLTRLMRVSKFFYHGIRNHPGWTPFRCTPDLPPYLAWKKAFVGKRISNSGWCLDEAKENVIFCVMTMFFAFEPGRAPSHIPQRRIKLLPHNTGNRNQFTKVQIGWQSRVRFAIELFDSGDEKIDLITWPETRNRIESSTRSEHRREPPTALEGFRRWQQCLPEMSFPIPVKQLKDERGRFLNEFQIN